MFEVHKCGAAFGGDIGRPIPEEWRWRAEEQQCISTCCKRRTLHDCLLPLERLMDEVRVVSSWIKAAVEGWFLRKRNLPITSLTVSMINTCWSLEPMMVAAEIAVLLFNAMFRLNSAFIWFDKMVRVWWLVRWRALTQPQPSLRGSGLLPANKLGTRRHHSFVSSWHVTLKRNFDAMQV